LYRSINYLNYITLHYKSQSGVVESTLIVDFEAYITVVVNN